MEAKEYLVWYKKSSQKYADKFLKKWQREAGEDSQISKEMVVKFIDLYPRGKMLRGALSVLGYQVAGGEDLKEMLKASIVMELMETSILIADDIFDRDEIRRGIPTIHRQWQDKLQVTSFKLQDRIHYGNSMAQITSIFGFHLIPLVLVETRFTREIKEKALSFYCQGLIKTAFGEALDISSSWQDVKEKQLSSQQIHDAKTVWYSAILPLTFGAILAGKKDDKWFLDLKQYAQILGRIFQIQDDIIGSFGDPKKTGKSNTSDIADGRWTVLVEILWKKAGKKDREILERVFGKSKRSDSEIKQVKDLMVKYEVVELARKRAERYLKEGLRIIPKITKNKKYEETMRELLYFMIKRAK